MSGMSTSDEVRRRRRQDDRANAALAHFRAKQLEGSRFRTGTLATLLRSNVTLGDVLQEYPHLGREQPANRRSERGPDQLPSKPRLLIDEELGSSIGHIFVAGGFDVAAVADSEATGGSREAVLDLARREQRAVVTLDTGFLEVCVRADSPECAAGIVIIDLMDEASASLDLAYRGLLEAVHLKRLQHAKIAAARRSLIARISSTAEASLTASVNADSGQRPVDELELQGLRTREVELRGEEEALGVQLQALQADCSAARSRAELLKASLTIADVAEPTEPSRGPAEDLARVSEVWGAHRNDLAKRLEMLVASLRVHRLDGKLWLVREDEICEYAN